MEMEQELQNIKTTTPVTPVKKSKQKITHNIDFTCNEFFEKIKPDISKYNLVELKAISRKHKIKMGKNKKEIIERINDFFERTSCANKIQSVCRGFFVRLFLKLVDYGKARINRVFTNENDFYSFEPLNEIDFKEFFYITDKNFNYGFNIKSLITMHKKNNSLINPYNRNAFSYDDYQRLFCAYSLLRILFKENALEEDSHRKNYNYTKIPKRIQIYNLFHPPSPPPVRTPALALAPVLVSSTSPSPSPIVIQRINTHIYFNDDDVDDNTTTNTTIHYFEHIRQTRQMMIQLRSRPLTQRINEVFIAIDQLGNYTNSSWFFNLNKALYYVYLFELYEIWMYRAQIPVLTKYSICPLGEPFVEPMSHIRIRYNNITEEQMCERCVYVMEEMIMTSHDEEFKKLGCLYVLTALTTVSPEAREQYTYLYDSVHY